ncbi:MAG: haloacid dehalogenase-like hydrolase [Bacteroidia bacterium]|nr:haloacid dehalogenase-like hydrolase [Bacteroidia bacterium]MCF8445922.1 haloacid dehalogenase-like hydrolase [Bacteroidia bacterium]
MKNLVIFDFCDTLVNFQTANEFCRYILKKRSKYLFIYLDFILEGLMIYRLIQKLKISNDLQKLLLLKALKGLTKEELDTFGIEFVDEVIEKSINRDVFSYFTKHQGDGDVVVINSGGYESYLKYFAIKHNVTYCYSSQFRYDGNVFVGSIAGDDCLGIEKVKRMKKDSILEKSYTEIIVFSDSPTDMPIFDLADRKVAVIKTKIIPTWCQTNFEIICLK